jgi:hypothetical protein
MNELTCDDQLDDDGDGDTDCADADCAESDACRPQGLTQADIQAIFNAECTPCHIRNTTMGLNLANDFTATTFNVPARQSDLDLIEPGDHTRSFLWHKINGSQRDVGGGGRMPDNGPPYLDQQTIDAIGAWIDALPH